MLKGAKKLKVSGILLIISSSLVISLYLIIANVLASGSGGLELFATHDSPDPNPNRGVGFTICAVVLFNLFKLLVGVLTVKRAKTTECKGIAGKAVLALYTLVGVWGVVIITSITDGVKESSDLSGMETLRFVVFAVFSVVDIVLLIEILIGTKQNSKGITAEQDQP